MKASRSFLTGGIYAIATRGAYALAQVMYLAVMARLLKPDDFGTFAIAVSITTVATMLSNFGFSTTIFQVKRLTSNEISALFWANLLLAVALSVALILARNIIGHFFQVPALSWAVLILAITVPFTAVASIFKALLSRHQKWKAVYPGFLVGQLLALFLSIIYAIFFRRDYTALLVNPAATAVFSMFIFGYYASWMPRLEVRFRETFGLLAHGSALSATGLGNFFNRQSDNLLIGWQWTASDLGFYTRAYAIFTIPSTILVIPLQPVILSGLRKLRHDEEAWRQRWMQGAVGLTLVTGLISVVTFRFSNSIVGLIYGSGWETAVPILQALSLSIPSVTIGQMLAWGMISTRGSGTLLVFSLSTSLLRFGAFWIAVPYGVLYVAVAWSVTSWVFPIFLVAVALRSGLLTWDNIFTSFAWPLFAIFASLGVAGIVFLLEKSGPMHCYWALFECMFYLALFGAVALRHPISRQFVIWLYLRLKPPSET